jgi:hypothetical protein
VTKKRRKTSISIETRRVLWLRNGRNFKLWCPECGEETSMLNIDDTVRQTHINTRELCRWINSNRIHFTETSDGLLLVCLNGLRKLTSIDGIDT